MSDRSDDTGSTPEVSGSEGAAPAPETPGDGDATPPPTGETGSDATTATGTDPADITAETSTESADATAATAATGTRAETERSTAPDTATVPSATEDPATAAETEAPPASAVASPLPDETPTRIAPAVATAPIDDPATPGPSRRTRKGAADTVPAPADTAPATLLAHPNGTPFLTARGLTAKGRQGPIFTDVDLTAHLGQVVAVCGDGGDGRTSLLLALTGRFAHHDGTLEVDGQTRLGPIRRRFTIAQAGPPIRFEPYATVGACIKETTTVSKGAATRTNIKAWLDRLAVEVDTGDTFGMLPRIDQIRFAIACAAASRTPAIAVDDTDTGLDHCGSERVFEALRTVADAGQLVIAACTRSDPPADTVVDLRTQHPTTARTPHHEDRPTDRPRRSERTRNGGHR